MVEKQQLTKFIVRKIGYRYKVSKGKVFVYAEGTAPGQLLLRDTYDLPTRRWLGHGTGILPQEAKDFIEDKFADN